MKSKFNVLFALFGMVLLVAACATDPKASKEYKDLQAELAQVKGQDSLEATNMALYKQMCEINDTTKMGQLDAIVAADVVNHDMDPRMTEKTGLDGLKEVLKMYFSAIPMKMEVMHIAAAGDLVLAHVHLTGVNSGNMGPDMPATNKTVDVTGFDCVRIEGGKIKEIWSVMNEKKMLQQLGMLPAEM